MHYVILKTPEFDHWYCDLSPKEQVQIDKLLSMVELDGHFGVHKQLLDVLWELKWLNGRRVYYA